MCNLYSLNKKRDAVAQFFRVSHNRASSFEPSSAIFPRHVAPVVRPTADGERRCLVPASSFSEPNGDVKPATWHWFSIIGAEARPLFVFPGIWRRYRGPVKKDGPNVDIETYAFLTTTPNSLVSTINHERMPVLLTREEEFDTWLRAPAAEAFALAREYPPEQMRIVQEGFEKEDLLKAA
jgi:putative SOS response-associated peptidase YedK